jgi:hypothetical protein
MALEEGLGEVTMTLWCDVVQWRDEIIVEGKRTASDRCIYIVGG